MHRDALERRVPLNKVNRVDTELLLTKYAHDQHAYQLPAGAEIIHRQTDLLDHHSVVSISLHRTLYRKAGTLLLPHVLGPRSLVFDVIVTHERRDVHNLSCLRIVKVLEGIPFAFYMVMREPPAILQIHERSILVLKIDRNVTTSGAASKARIDEVRGADKEMTFAYLELPPGGILVEGRLEETTGVFAYGHAAFQLALLLTSPDHEPVFPAIHEDG